jgi:N-acetylneuraminic acid mutarotase
MTHRFLFVAVVVLCGAAVASAGDFKRPMPFPNLPEGISSFGATICDDHLYVFGGHVGRIPGNSQDALSPHFVRINVTNPANQWESLPMQNSSQSPGLLAWNGKVYRVGGLSFDNRQGEETVYHSLDEFSRFDPTTKTWTALPSLPAPRSSLDAAVVEGKLYVVGGWNLQGTNVMEAPWHEDSLVFDLSKEDGQWTPVAKPPFVKRALAVAGHDHKVWVLGGMSKTNQITTDVHSYDPKTDTWTAGPAVKGREQFAAFAMSAFECAGKLCYSGTDGVLYTLDDQKSEWVPQERLMFNRSFHRLAAGEGDAIYAVAGISRSTYLPTVERIELTEGRHSVAKVAEWTVPFAGQVKQGQTTLLSGNSLYALGGNGSRNPHDFSKEAILSEAYRYDLGTRTVEALPSLPTAVQSGAAYLAGSRIDQSIFVLGGITNPGEKYESVDTILRYRMRSKAWVDETVRLPGKRSMFSVVSHGGSAWIFGGSEVTGHGGGLIGETWQWSGSPEEAPVAVAEAALPIPRRSFGAAVLAGKFYAVGGLGAESKIVDKVNVYDLETRQWSDAPSPSVSRVFPSLAVVGGKLYLSGGFARVDGHFQKVESIEQFDPKTNAWTVAYESLPFDASGRQMVEFHDRLLFYGLDPEKEGIAHFALLDPTPEAQDYGVTPPQPQDGGAGAELVARLLKMDRDNDGKLTKDEVGQRFSRMIERLDTDKDGFVTKAELEASAAKETGAAAGGAGGGFGNPSRSANRVLEQNDADKDDALSGAEIPERLKPNVEKIDANKDGKLDKAELEAWFESRAQERPTTGGGARPATN